MTDQHTAPMDLGEDLRIQFMAMVDCDHEGCWPWIGAQVGTGYGTFHLGNGRMGLAHRIAYAMSVGPIPLNHDIHHTCGVRLCVNPAHLRAVTRAQHVRLEGKATWTHCIHGHEFTPENTRVYTDREGYSHRQCRACYRERSRRRRERVA